MSIPEKMVKPRTSACRQFNVDQNGATPQVSHVLLRQTLVKREKTKEWYLRAQHKIAPSKDCAKTIKPSDQKYSQGGARGDAKGTVATTHCSPVPLSQVKVLFVPTEYSRKKQNNISVETKIAQMDRKEDGNKITEAKANKPGHLSPQSMVSHH